MADIDVERKGTSIWPWIIGLLVLALLIWALMKMFDTDDPEVAGVATDPVATEPVVTPAPIAPVVAGPTIADVLANPSAYVGQSFTTDTVRVAEVVADRGFWIEGTTGQRLFVVKNESPREGVADVQGQADVRSGRDVNAGDRLQINGTLHDGGKLDALQPPLDATTRQAVEGQPIFLQANVADIQHVS